MKIYKVFDYCSWWGDEDIEYYLNEESAKKDYDARSYRRQIEEIDVITDSQAKYLNENVEEIDTEDKAVTIYILTAYDASRDEHTDTYYLSQENAEAAAKALEDKGENAVIGVVSTED